MKRNQLITRLNCTLILLFSALLLLGGCLHKVDRTVTNYYVLDYLPATENDQLRLAKPFPKNIEVLDATIDRTYSRNQLVVKDSFTRIRYLPFDIWANRLSDAIPNLVAQRLRAYNIFRRVDRDAAEAAPDYYLQINILNVEKIEGLHPKAHLRLEFLLRDAKSQSVLLSYKPERYSELPDNSTVYLVQTYNVMLMQETDIFAAKCRLFLEGKDEETDLLPEKQSPLQNFVYTAASEAAAETAGGELLLPLLSNQNTVIRYTVEQMNEDGDIVNRLEAEFGKELPLEPGNYLITIGENQEIQIPAEIKPRMRTVVSGQWSELVVKIMDQSQTRVRLPYDLWIKDADEYDYYLYGSDTSIGDEDLGQPDKVWILKPGTYMIKLGGFWNDFKDFTTVNINPGQNEILTVVVDPSGEGNFMIGAGILGEEPLFRDKPLVHKGAIHGNINLNTRNSDDQKDAEFNLNIIGQLENNLDLSFPYSHYTARSIYDLGMSHGTGRDLQISTDSYSLKNVMLFTPWEAREKLKDFSFYGRLDLKTHFFDETRKFDDPKNLLVLSHKSDTLQVLTNADHLKTKQPFFPMNLKEGLGITYRWVMNPKVALSLRGGYGWQQEFNRDSYNFVERTLVDSLYYDMYMEGSDKNDHGLESTLILSALNLMRFLNINSTFEVFIPMNRDHVRPRFESESRFNIRLYRNVSLDLKLTAAYERKDERARQDWIVYGLDSFLRISLYY